MQTKVIAAVSLFDRSDRKSLVSYWSPSHLPAMTMAIPSPYKVFLSLASRSCLADQLIK